jgi:hypothetical protein
MRQSPARKRRLAVLLALGAVAYLLLRKREAVAELAEPRGGWRARLPWAARSRRIAVPTETHEPTVGATPSESGAVTAGGEGAAVETPEKVTSF